MAKSMIAATRSAADLTARLCFPALGVMSVTLGISVSYDNVGHGENGPDNDHGSGETESLLTGHSLGCAMVGEDRCVVHSTGGRYFTGLGIYDNPPVKLSGMERPSKDGERFHDSASFWLSHAFA